MPRQMKYRMILPVLASMLVIFGGSFGELRAGTRSGRDAVLVADGRAHGVLLVPASGEVYRQEALRFAHMVERATGVSLTLVSDDQVDSLSGENLIVSIGPTDLAKAKGLMDVALEEEGYRIVRDGRIWYLLGDVGDGRPSARPQSCPLRWALNSILEESLGVRWLWPGELGTYIPARDELALPESRTYQPRLEVRSLRLSLKAYREDAPLVREAVAWAEDHQAGRRGAIRMGHAFIDWWKQYAQTNPDYFARTPDGIEQPFLGAGYVKLRLANPAVLEQIVEDYRKAGAPDYWNVAPNDRYGFDISEETRAWDLPTDLPVNKIWRGEVNLTPRYVMFWNRIYEHLKEINPKVKLMTYAYYSYFTPPPTERPLTAKCIIGIVTSYQRQDVWDGWAKTGSSLLLRPNWWHLGAEAPHLPISQVDRYFKHASENGMIGIDMDSVLGHWSTQGFNYYLVARLMTRPELPLESIIHEYTAAFGKGAGAIGEYLRYFEKLTDRYDYPHEEGSLARLVQDGKIDNRWAKGGQQALAFLWDEEVLKPAYALLDQAKEAINDPKSLAHQRVIFLWKGLDHLAKKREVIQLSEEAGRHPSDDNLKAFAVARRALDQMRVGLSREHVVWGKTAQRYEDGHRVFVQRSDERVELLPEEM